MTLLILKGRRWSAATPATRFSVGKMTIRQDNKTTITDDCTVILLSAGEAVQRLWPLSITRLRNLSLLQGHAEARGQGVLQATV